jgi:Pentapeptide repeats (8 copies)
MDRRCGNEGRHRARDDWTHRGLCGRAPSRRFVSGIRRQRRRGRRPAVRLVRLATGVSRWGRNIVRADRHWLTVESAGYVALALGVGAIAAFIWVPGLLVHGYAFSDDTERARALNDARASVLQLVAGLVVLGGAYLTARTLRLSRAGHLSDRFSKAAEQLGHDRPQTRVGAIYALERIMRDAPLEQRAVLETLVGFLRETRALGQGHGSTPANDDPAAPPADAAAALRVIGRRMVSHDPVGKERFGWNLTQLDLRDFSLRSGNFAGVNLWRSDLRRANLKGADLRDTRGLADAAVTGAVYDSATFFPKGFDAQAHGLRRSERPEPAPGELLA